MKSLIKTTCFLSLREPAAHSLLLTVLLCSCCMHAQAQNIEGQVVASQYGEWKVPSIGIGFTFDPASCQLSGGGKNFAAFSNGTPIKVVDENPGLTEVSNTTVYAHVDSSSCSVSLGGLTYGHTSFYLTSGTGGLQEALNNASIRVGGPNTIILNAEWYELVAPGNPATVIGAAIGGSGFGLVDVTTAPYTYYSWSGGHFNVISSGGGSPTGPAGGSLSGTYPNPGLSSTVAIPPGATATTQSNGDNSTKLATTAYVAANSGGAPSGSAGGSLSGTYPNPGLSSTVAIPSGATATTQTAGDNSTKVATDAFVQANLPGIPVSSVFGRVGSVVANSGDYTVSQVTGAAPLASPALTGSPTAPTQTTGDNSTKIATDAFVLANGRVTWPTSADIVLSDGTNSPAGLAPVNGDCIVGSGGAWTAGSCPGGGTTTNSLTLNNSGSGASSGAIFNGSAAVTLSYNTIGAAPLASPALTGTPTAPTQTTSDTSTDIATDAFVHNNLAPYATIASPALTGTPTAPTQSCASNADIATGAYVANCSGSGMWSGLGNPTANLALTMAAYTSTFAYNAATGASDLFKLTDTASNTGTGIMAHFTTASGSTEIPWQADANGVGYQITATGALKSTDTVNNAALVFQPGSGGASTCPTAVSGSSFLCTNANDGISYSNNGSAYSPLSAQPIPYTITSGASPAINLTNGSVQSITLSANATATLSGITSGASLTLQICQPSSGGPYTWTWPSAIHGGITIGTTASDCSMQEFKSFNGTTLVSISGGVLNVAP